VDLVEIDVKDLWIPHVIAGALQRACDVVVNDASVGRLINRQADSASSRIYPRPFSDSVGLVHMFVSDAKRSVVRLTISLYRLRREHERGKKTIPESTARALTFRFDGMSKQHRMNLDWEERIAQLAVTVPLQVLGQHPRLLVGPSN
jgi:hypothetical protein